MAKKPLQLGTWRQIWTEPVSFDSRGRPDMFQARTNYRDFDGRTRDVTLRVHRRRQPHRVRRNHHL